MPFAGKMHYGARRMIPLLSQALDHYRQGTGGCQVLLSNTQDNSKVVSELIRYSRVATIPCGCCC